MNLGGILKTLQDIAEEKGLSRPFVCGGVPRDKVLGRHSDFGDIDITTGDQGIHYLAKEAAIRLKSENSHYELMPDGHARIFLENLKLDFSSNFNIPGIRYLLKKSGIKTPDPMQMELYSRDFTCNALLMSMDLKTISDPTGLGIPDIKKRIIKTCLPVNLTLGYDNRRIIRIIYLASKLQFDIDEEIIEWVKEHPSLIKNCRPQYLAKKLSKSIKYDKERTMELLDKMDLWKYVPPLASLVPAMTQSVERL